MSATTNQSGVGCCGNCGAELEVRCTGGCPEPDVAFKENAIASMPKPRAGGGMQKNSAKYPPPTHCRCGDPVAARKPGRGRPPTKCEKHLPPSRAKVVR